jgi:hypothetical protein
MEMVLNWFLLRKVVYVILRFAQDDNSLLTLSATKTDGKGGGSIASAPPASSSAIAAASSTSASSASASSFFAGPGLVDRQRASVVLLPVQPLNGGLGFLVVAHFHEAKSLAAAAVAVRNNLGAVHGAEGGKQVLQFGIADAESQISNVQFLSQGKSPVCGVQKPRLVPPQGKR